MNLALCTLLLVAITNPMTESVVQPWKRQAAWYRPPSAHHLARRHVLPYWFLMEQAFGDSDFYDRRRLRRNRNAADIFAAGDPTGTAIGLERYPQQPADAFSDPVVDTFFGEDMNKAANVGDPLDTSATINFGMHDLFKFRPLYHNRRPPCKTDDNATRPTSNASTVIDDIHLQVVQESQDSTWTPVVNETDCQTYGPSTFCENVANYPTEKVKELLMANNQSLLTTFFSDNIPAIRQSTEAPPITEESDIAPFSVNTRIRPSSDVVHLCDSKTDYSFPKSAKNQNGEMLMIVNQDNISQPITIETCRSENGPCHYAENFPAGYKAFCMQKYVTHHLAALRDGKIVREAFTIPSCCVCALKQSLSIQRTNTPTSSRMSPRSPSRASSTAGNGRPSQ